VGNFFFAVQKPEFYFFHLGGVDVENHLQIVYCELRITDYELKAWIPDRPRRALLRPE
jgi:hypothetical protein